MPNIIYFIHTKVFYQLFWEVEKKEKKFLELWERCDMKEEIILRIMPLAGTVW